MYSFWGKSSDYIELEGWHWHVGWITLTINLQGLSVVCTRIYWMQFITLLYFLHHVTVIQTKLCKEIFEIENKCSTSLKSWLYTLSPLESAVLSSKIHRMNKRGVFLCWKCTLECFQMRDIFYTPVWKHNVWIWLSLLLFNIKCYGALRTPYVFQPMWGIRTFFYSMCCKTGTHQDQW